jgi:hypothetical protein
MSLQSLLAHQSLRIFLGENHWLRLELLLSVASPRGCAEADGRANSVLVTETHWFVRCSDFFLLAT